MSVNQEKLEALAGRLLGDLGAAFMVPLVRIGDKLGLYRAMANAGPVSSVELARLTGTAERYVREWLSAHAASGYVDYDAELDRFELTAEQAMVFANPESPAFMLGGFEVAAANTNDMNKVAEAFQTGRGVGWHEHCSCLFRGVERFFRPGYLANLVQNWLPALDGVVARLERGARVADIGCGHGATTILMAKAFPKSEFIGFDMHEPSILRARANAEEERTAGNVRFEVAGAKDFPGRHYDLITAFDCLHDMGDPVGAAKHARQALSEDGAWMLVEPLAHDRLADNLNPVSRVYYAASTMVCTPTSLAQDVGLGLGAQAGQSRLTSVLKAGGFTRVRRAAETAFNMVLEVRP